MKKLILSAIAGVISFTSFSQSGEKWSFGLNAPSGTSALGTSNNFPLIIKTNSTEKLRVAPSGNVGIGNSNPSERLDVSGRVKIRGNAFFDSLVSALFVQAQTASFTSLTTTNAVISGQLTSSSITSSTGNISFSNNNLSTTGNLSAANITTSGTLSAQTILQNGNPINQSQWITSVSNIYYNGGNVGIGTSTPSEKLEIDGKLRISSSAAALPPPVIPTPPPPVYALPAAPSTYTIPSGNQSSIIFDGGVDQITATSGRIDFVTTNLVTLGKIGIGTQTPAFPLEVAGTVKVTGPVTNPPSVQQQSLIFDGGTDAITATSGTLTFPNTNLVTTGSISAQNITIGALDVSGEVRADSVRTKIISGVKRMEVTDGIVADTLYALTSITAKERITAKDICIGSDSAGMPSDICNKTGDLILQSDQGITNNTLINADNTGRVGIGTLNPTEKLSVVGDAKVSGSITGTSFMFDSQNGFRFTPAGPTNSARISTGAPVPLLATCLTLDQNPWFEHKGWIQSRMTNPTVNQVNAALTLGCANWNGSGVIEVEGTDDLGGDNNGLLINYFCGRNTAINVNSSLPNHGGWVNMGEQVNMAKHVEIGSAQYGIADPNNTALDIHVNDGKGIKFKTYNNAIKLISIESAAFPAYSPFNVYGDGKVGINTEYVPSLFVLAVNGRAIAEEYVVRLRMDWPDYKFTEKLTPWEDFQNEIVKLGHFPGLPSAKEVDKEKTFPLGEVQEGHLAITELLYRYLGETKNEVADLKLENEKLKQNNEAMKTRMKLIEKSLGQIKSGK